MLDEELIEMLTPTLPENIPYVFISSVANIGIQQLKDILWEELNKDSNRLEGLRQASIVHRAKDVTKLQQELKDMVKMKTSISNMKMLTTMKISTTNMRK